MWVWHMLHRQNKQTFRNTYQGARIQPDSRLAEKSKLAHHVYEEDHKICCIKVKILQTEPIAHTGNAGHSPRGSGGSSDQSTQLVQLYHLDFYHSSRSQ
jgi:hypothetical protein